MVQWYCLARKVYDNEGYFFKVLCLQAADHDCYLELSALVRCKSYPKDWRFQIKPDTKHMPVAINISFGDHGTTCFRGAQAGHKQIVIHPRTPQLYALNHHRSHIDGPKQRTGGHVGVPPGVPRKSCECWTRFLPKHFLLFQWTCTAAGLEWKRSIASSNHRDHTGLYKYTR